MKPIYHWREIVGHAFTIEDAKRYLKKHLNLSDKATLYVWERSPEVCMMNNLESGFVYSVSWDKK
jgi:hypothetical protein